MARAKSDEPTLEYVFVDDAGGELQVACTHVDRVMFADVGITKAEVIGYYHHVAPVMLPELVERPISVERFTKGVDAGGFFQKHYQRHYPTWLARAELGAKTKVVYPIIENAAGLVYLANQGSVAFHVWTSRRATPEHPDLLVFDLDPPDGKFEMVRRTALIVRALCDELALPAFVKTTGSKGLHVVVPLDGRATYTAALALCGRIAALLCARHPDLLTVEFYKKDRKGRLYFDVMRNALGATMIAPWSLRGRPGAPISMPITWSEVEDPALAPNGFTLRDARARLDRAGDPWENLRARLGNVGDAEAALDRLA